jgi:hypothetical protein
MPSEPKMQTLREQIRDLRFELREAIAREMEASGDEALDAMTVTIGGSAFKVAKIVWALDYMIEVERMARPVDYLTDLVWEVTPEDSYRIAIATPLPGEL